MIKHLFTAFFVLLCVSVFAQTGTIKGVVTGDDGLSVIGGTVVVKGTTIGASTDFDGNYELKSVPIGDQTVVFSFIGLKTQEKQVNVKEGETATVDVKLSEDVMLLDQVVVVGFGTTQKRDVTGSIATIKAEAIESSTQPSVDQALQGKAAGVSIISQNGISGSAVKSMFEVQTQLQLVLSHLSWLMVFRSLPEISTQATLVQVPMRYLILIRMTLKVLRF